MKLKFENILKKNNDYFIDYEKADHIFRKQNNNVKLKFNNKIAILLFNVEEMKSYEPILQHMHNNSFDIIYNLENLDSIHNLIKGNKNYNYRSLSSIFIKNEIYAVSVSHLMWFAWHISKFMPNFIAKNI